jgi:hypothetical protein
MVLFLFSCAVGPQGEAAVETGPKTVAVDAGIYQIILYVADDAGSDTNGDGSREKPWASVQKALSSAVNATPENRCAIFLTAGDYSKETIRMKPYVDIYGGFDPVSWERDIERYPTELQGDEKRRVIIGADNAILDGVIVSEGRIRGKGAGLYCNGTSPTITNNVFIRNRSLGPSPWRPKFRHEISNDGGAVYCENGSSPIIENNLFADNTTENGRGAAIAFHSRCGGRIVNNCFLRNRAGLKDPLRSSDGGAVSIFDWSSPLVENNVFLNNEALADNDAGGMFVALWSAPEIRENIFVGNQCTDDAGALFIGGQEHRYDAPLDPLPPKESFYVKIHDNLFIGNKNPSSNSGVTRFTMEGRGEFIGNVTAHNTGVYFQRSEVLIENNLMLDNFRLVETKEGLNPCVIRNNVIWGEFDVQVEAEVTGNTIRGGASDSRSTVPRLKTNGFSIRPDAVYGERSGTKTELFVSQGNYRENALVGRVVRSGNHWGVIKSNTRTHIQIWGDFYGQMEIFILPEYRTL